MASEMENAADPLLKQQQAWDRRQARTDGLKFGIVSSFTCERLVPYLGGALILANTPPSEIVCAPFNQIPQTSENPRPAFGLDVDIAIVLWRIEDISASALDRFCAGDENAETAIIEAVSFVVEAAVRLKERHKIQTILALPPKPLHIASLPMRAALAPRMSRLHRMILDRTLDAVETHSLAALDMDALLAAQGYDTANDWTRWYLYRQPYTESFLGSLGRELTRVVLSFRISRKKCIVLDCDNTLWGGVVGEDGIGGIALSEDFPGSPFRDFQRQLALLARNGVFLAIASKNNPDDVWQVFAEHDGMILRKEDISVAEIGWQDKCLSLENIASALNIGLDSIVFVDDSAFEMDNVRSRLPDVTCLHVPEDIENLPALLPTSRLFDQAHISREDRGRVAGFRAEVERKTFAVGQSIEDYQASLGLVLTVSEARPADTARVTQLLNKTNQFNLTTRRRTADEVAELISDQKCSVHVARLNDRFGDYGLIGVSISFDDEDRREIDTFLLSCRALGRTVEFAFIDAVLRSAQDHGFKRVRSCFIPTRKNAVASSFLGDADFEAISEELFEIDLEKRIAFKGPVRVEFVGGVPDAAV
jgi:FkbH-like protein